MVKAPVGKSFYYSSFTSSGEVAATGNWQLLTYVETLPSSLSPSYPRIAVKTVSNGDTAQVASFMIIDLTLEGLGLTTAAAFQSLHPLPYYPYNSGKIVNNDAEGLETTGFNKWDASQRVNGKYISWSTGNENPAADYSHTGYIPVLPDKDYYFKQSANIGQWGAFYDANMRYISGLQTFGAPGNEIFHTPAGCAYVRISFNRTEADTDICCNISDASRNGTYQPYWKRDLALKLKEVTGIPVGGSEADRVTIFPDGPAGAGTAQDMFYEENGVAKAKKVMSEEVDMGDLSWTIANAGMSTERPVSDGLQALIKRPGANTEIINAISTKFTADSAQNVYLHSANLTFGTPTNGDLQIYDASLIGKTGAEVQTAVSGVKLRYELVSPIIYTDLRNADGTPFEMPKNILVDNLGTEKAIYPAHADGSPSAPFECDSNYSVGIANLVRRLNALENA
jgi:hypothetical protein